MRRTIPFVLMLCAVLAVTAVVLVDARPSPAQPPVNPPVRTRTNPGFPDFNTDNVPVVQGVVAIANSPTVHALQADEWGVRLVGQPVVSAPTPGFLVVGSVYELTWPGSAQAGLFRVRALGANGWIQAEELGGPNRAVRWLNTALVATIEEVRQ